MHVASTVHSFLLLQNGRNVKKIFQTQNFQFPPKPVGGCWGEGSSILPDCLAGVLQNKNNKVTICEVSDSPYSQNEIRENGSQR